MLKVLIVDDEPPARARLRQLLADVSGQVPTAVVGEADSGARAIEQIDALQPDVVLLDIHMPGINGIEAARHLAARERPPAIVFITAYDEHALQAFEVQALDYLLKPVKADRLPRSAAPPGWRPTSRGWRRWHSRSAAGART